MFQRFCYLKKIEKQCCNWQKEIRTHDILIMSRVFHPLDRTYNALKLMNREIGCGNATQLEKCNARRIYFDALEAKKTEKLYYIKVSFVENESEKVESLSSQQKINVCVSIYGVYPRFGQA
jgi:hypothetical protein